MSNGKKTAEKLLEETLVPEEEQPYEVPENWIWTRLGGLGELKGRIGWRGYTKSDLREAGPLVLGAAQINKKDKIDLSDPVHISVEKFEESPEIQVNIGDILIVKTGASIGKIALIKEQIGDACINPNVALLKNIGINNFYLALYMQTRHFKNALWDKVNSSAQPAINQASIKTTSIPVPPVNEQKRIAEKVGELLNKIEEAKRLIEEAKETFELRRTAILDKAFRGELTEKWRDENPLKRSNLIKSNEEFKGYFEVPEDWKWTELKKVTAFKSGYAFKSKDFVEQGIQLVRMGNLYNNELSLDRNPVYLPMDYDKKLIEKYSVNNGDILLSLTGTKYKRDYGYAVRVEGIEKPLLLNQRILSLNPNFMDEYIFYYLQSSVFRDVFFSFETGGVNQGNVGSKAVESILIPIPPLEEAKEIEKMLNNILKNEKETLKILIVEDKLETLKQAILSKAFCGELGTNDSSEENAIELLKEVLLSK